MTSRHYKRVNPVLYDAGRRTMRFLFHAMADIHFSFEESVPTEGPAIVVVNHLSYLDGPLLYAMLPMRIRPIVAEFLRRHLFTPLLALTGPLYVQRGHPDRAMMRAAAEILEDGGTLAVAIEGRRSRDGRMQAGKNGVAYLAAKSGAPVIPAAVWGTEQVARALLRFRRAEVHLRLGTPLHFGAAEVDVARLDESTRAVVSTIALMLPERYRPDGEDARGAA